MSHITPKLGLCIILLTVLALWTGVRAADPPAASKPAYPAEARDVVFSQDRRHVAYVMPRGQKQCVVVDGQVGAEYDEICKGPIFSPYSNRVAYIAKKGKKSLVVVDGQPGAEYYNAINGDSLIFSPDGKRVAYVLENPGMIFPLRPGEVPLDNRPFVVVDGKAGAKYDRIFNLIFSPDSKRVAYIVHKNMGGGRFVVVDGQAGTEYKWVTSLIFSPDGKRVAYTARKGEKSLVVVDGKPGAEYDDILKDFPIFSPDGKRVAYVARKDQKYLVVVEGQAGAEYDKIYNLVFSPDGQLAYKAEKDGKLLVVLDDSRARSTPTSATAP